MTIGTAIVVVAAIYFLIVSPGFRMLAIMVLLAGGIGIVYWINRDQERSREWQTAQEQAERVPEVIIRPEELSLTDVQLVTPSYASALSTDDWLMTGTVTNNSTHELVELEFQITVKDCSKRPAQMSGQQYRADECLTVGEQRVSVYLDGSGTYTKSLTVPAGHTRSFSSNAIRFIGMPPAPRAGAFRRFTWKVVEVRADEWESYARGFPPRGR
jgi:hypothetical protein